MSVFKPKKAKHTPVTDELIDKAHLIQNSVETEFIHSMKTPKKLTFEYSPKKDRLTLTFQTRDGEHRYEFHKDDINYFLRVTEAIKYPILMAQADERGYKNPDDLPF